ncbi:MAG: DUF3810 domain-containing protein [Angelakisella sp.]|nr:DUF3810 domain-containing protein [Angelakisella sp.]
MKRTTKVWCTALCALTPISFLLIALAKANPKATEEIFSLGFYRHWSALLSALTSPLPFSVAEWLLMFLAIAVVALAFLFLRALLHKTGKDRLWFAGRCMLVTAAFASVAFFVFTVSSGLNYYRYTFLEYSGLTIRPSEISELKELCLALAQDANKLRTMCAEDENGVFALSGSFDELGKAANTGYRNLMDKNPNWQPLFGQSADTRPKPVFFSEAMSYMQIVGVFFPFTMEANVNVHTSNIDIPHSICHELAHISGMMREDEANYIGYLACMASGNHDLAYSGTMMALIHATNALYSYSTQSHGEVMATLEDAVRRDLAADSEYYYAHKTTFGEFSNKVNDVYLKANDQFDGVVSYGRMVDLLLAQYRQSHSSD